MYDVVIIGAGASGLMCASVLVNNKNLKVLLIEKNDKIGKKILITGNGRCNLGNVNNSVTNYNSNDFDLFKTYFNEDNLMLIEEKLSELGIVTKIENGRKYPYSMQSSTVCKSFERYLKTSGILTKLNFEVNSIDKSGDYFIINNKIKSKNIVVATGGKAYPKTGSTGDGYVFLKKFDHFITNLYPSLTSLKTNYRYIKDIAGVRFDGVVKLIINDMEFANEIGQIQFTSTSISGICVFNISCFVKRALESGKKVRVMVDLIPEYDTNYLIKYISKFLNYKIEDCLSGILNNKLSQVVIKELGLLGKKVSQLSLSDLNKIIKKIKNMNFDIIDTGDFNCSQVTAGGASLLDFDNSLQSKKIKGLYAAGEVVDVDGKCGGYNLTWAFVSALIVAKNILKSK